MQMKTKSLIFSRTGLLILLLTGSVIRAEGQTYTESKQIVRSFPARSETRLDVSNKYGKIQVIPWKKDSVRIEVELFLKSTSTAKLDKIQENIDFDFTGTNYYIIAQTNFGNKFNTFFSDLRDLSETLIPSKNKVEINYTINLPSNISLNISNKYGDIYLDDLKGPVNINLSNGDIKANRLEGVANINLNFGNGIINYYQGGRLTLTFADIEIKQAGNLDIDSKSSRIEINEAGIINMQSRRDKLSATSITDIFGNSYFSEIWINNLNEEVNFNPTYGTFRVSQINGSFTFISLKSEYTDLDLVFSRSPGYTIDLTYNPEATITYPEEKAHVEKAEESDVLTRIRGTIGEAGQGKVKIIASKKCNISLHEH